jgi:phosphoenolpyruvate synthase/pyruvate phosphate dikinase
MSNAANTEATYVASFGLRMTDVESVGGKNASLGEMISQLASAGVRVPGGFATTAQAFRDFYRIRSMAVFRLRNVSLTVLSIWILMMSKNWQKLVPKFVNGLRKHLFSHVCKKRLKNFTTVWLQIRRQKCRLQYALPLPRKICQMHLLPASKKLS